jgi:hypothetical protein
VPPRLQPIRYRPQLDRAARLHAARERLSGLQSAGVASALVGVVMVWMRYRRSYLARVGVAEAKARGGQRSIRRRRTSPCRTPKRGYSNQARRQRRLIVRAWL